MDGSIVFARWRQCVFPCGDIIATWRIRLNLCFLQPTRVHNPNSKSIDSVVSAQLTAESPYTLQWATLFPKLPLLMRGVLAGPHVIRDSLGQSESTIDTASRSVQPFLQGSLAWQTDRQTDKQRYSVGNSRPHVRNFEIRSSFDEAIRARV